MKILENSGIRAEIDEQSLTVVVRKGKKIWRMSEEGPGDLGVKGHCGPYQAFPFREAKNREWRDLDKNSCECTLTRWPYSANVWSPLAFGVTVRYRLKDDTLTIFVIPHMQQRLEASLIDSWYPRGFLFEDKDKGELVLPVQQGTLLDKDETVPMDLTLPVYVGPGFQMPWWGQLSKDGAGLIALTPTPDDMGVRITNKSGHGATCQPYWQASLGGLKYMREISFTFFEHTSVMELAKAYRKHATEQGQAIPLRMKIKSKPALKSMIGGTIWNVWMMSTFKKFRMPDRVNYITFDEALSRYLKLKELTGFRQIQVHIDGWGKDGYDYNHPDVLPPDERLGGWAGMKRFIDAIHRNGDIVVLHDNYVDFYMHTEAYKSGHEGVMNMDGLRHNSDEWLGGEQEWLCASRSLKYIVRNLDEIEEKCPVDGEYVDCWSIGHLRECFDQNHPSTRTATRESWTRCLAEYFQRGLLVGSESGNDWAVPGLDFCHTVQPDYIPHVLTGELSSFGKSIPLYAMVWHDCLVIPAWIDPRRKPALIKDGLIIPQVKDSRLWCLLWGGMPSYRMDSMENITLPADYDFEKEADFIKSLHVLSRFHAGIGLEEITGWEMLDENGMIQKTTFANGDSAEVNFSTGDYTLVIDGKEEKGCFPQG